MKTRDLMDDYLYATKEVTARVKKDTEYLKRDFYLLIKEIEDLIDTKIIFQKIQVINPLKENSPLKNKIKNFY